MVPTPDAPERIVLLCRLVLAVADPRAGGLEAALSACHGADSVAPGDVEETLLVAIPYCGFPGSIEALGRWRVLAPTAAPAPQPAPEGDLGELGERVFGEVYGDLAPRVLRELIRRDPRVAQWIREFAYGRVMGGSALPLHDMEALGVAALLGQERRAPLHSHLRGAWRAGWSTAGLHGLVTALEDRTSAAIADYAHTVVDALPTT